MRTFRFLASCDDVKPGTVFIAEDLDDGPEIGYLSGTFSAHWESGDDPVEFEDGPEGVSAEEAIEWGRARTDVVLIRVGEGGYMSAGARQPPDEVLPEWPASGIELARRRAPSYSYLDRTRSDPAIDWDVRIDLQELEEADPADVDDRAARVLRALSQDPDVSDLVSSRDEELGPARSGIGGHVCTLSIRFRLHASTYDDANQCALAISQRATAGDGISPLGMSMSVEPSSRDAPSQ